VVAEKKTIKEELKEEDEVEETLPEEIQTQKVELTEEAKSDEIALPFQRMNIKEYLWRILIIKRVEVRDVILKKTNQVTQISYIDGYIIDDKELEEKLIEKIVDSQTIPVDMIKEINKHKKEVYIYSSSQGVYNSLMRSVVPKLRTGAVMVGVALQQSDYPQPMVVLVHPSQLPALKAQYEAMEKAKR